MNFTEVFLQKKLRLTEQLLQGFDIANDLAIYRQKTTIKDGVSHSYTDARSHHPLLVRKSLDSHEHLSMFPVVFDYLDLMVDQKHGTSDKAFREKRSIFRRKNRQPDPLLRHIEIMVFDYAITVRNKLVHHKTRFSACGKFLQVKAGMRLEIAHFGLLNRLIYFLVRRMQAPEPLNLYQRALLVSAYRAIFGHLDNKLDGLVASGPRLPSMNIKRPRYLFDMAQENIAEDVVIFDKLALFPDPSGYPDHQAFLKAHPDPDRKILYGNYTYLLSYRGSVLRVPAEAINQHPDYRLADFRHWKEQAAQATRQM
ncbi:hypothetical protein SAMN04489802_4274 [Pseudomonas chlororaphis]|uniref:hypothetical protein n=1 Tax=Pseudomonas chlororaphis TaxID=587753 RepID=UPI00087D6C63|nr:hypothetical protein [Pseudomonas chlororaphis]AZD66123.1 hypothetical protein C4K17_2237 [Pseudomonas chlororaphis subsp. aurantiaca]QIT22213.1 hypothetical protein HCN09_10920 [Pseudomonas chlororaphis subsp. aurantiaca]WDH06368.1 hypothetical protein PUP57_12020 [Pseudomonas chlororaphis]WDH10877.1 hypothetical protein PUP64_02760 [Pseudomonas chlororaphis]SDT39233.1 hypothetical protein SAMN04489802_4274 [Pseudomonas chlororaphis]